MLTTCPNCRNIIPKVLYCPKCGYPLYFMNRDLDNGNYAKTLTFRGESNHEVNSIICTRKKNIGLGSAEEEPHIDKRTSAVFDEEDSSSRFEDDDLDWIKMLKRLNIGDEKVKEIEDEWIKLINQLRKLSGVL